MQNARLLELGDRVQRLDDGDGDAAIACATAAGSSVAL